eukprot:gene19002-28476_t
MFVCIIALVLRRLLHLAALIITDSNCADARVLSCWILVWFLLFLFRL